MPRLAEGGMLALPMRLKGVHHVAIKSADPAALARFYCDLLDLPEEARHEDERGLRSIWLTAGEAILMIERCEAREVAPARTFGDDPPGLHLLALAIAPEDRSAWRTRLEQGGHAIVFETAYTIYVQDPEGNRVGLSHWPEGG